MPFVFLIVLNLYIDWDPIWYLFVMNVMPLPFKLLSINSAGRWIYENITIYDYFGNYIHAVSPTYGWMHIVSLLYLGQIYSLLRANTMIFLKLITVINLRKRRKERARWFVENAFVPRSKRGRGAIFSFTHKLLFCRVDMTFCVCFGNWIEFTLWLAAKA